MDGRGGSRRKEPRQPSDKFQGDVKKGERAGKGGGVDRKFGAT